VRGGGRGGKWDRVWPLIVTSVLGLKKNPISTSSDPARDFRRALTKNCFLSWTFILQAQDMCLSTTAAALNLAPKKTSTRTAAGTRTAGSMHWHTDPTSLSAQRTGVNRRRKQKPGHRISVIRGAIGILFRLCPQRPHITLTIYLFLLYFALDIKQTKQISSIKIQL
jgi:hypothetical protein